MMWAVHNIHAAAVQIDANGCHNLGGPDLQLADPIFTKSTQQEAEQERMARLTAFTRILKGAQ